MERSSPQATRTNIMKNELLTGAELDRLADQVDQELIELRDPAQSLLKGRSGQAVSVVPEKQRKVIEQATGETAESFWEKYKRAARKDLCHENGLLYQQWHKWRDLQSKDAVKVTYGLLAGLEISGAALPVVAVAASVILLNLVANIGVSAICENAEEEGRKTAE